MGGKDQWRSGVCAYQARDEVRRMTGRRLTSGGGGAGRGDPPSLVDGQ